MPKPSLEFDALGTHWWIETPNKTLSQGDKDKVLQKVMTFQSDYSRFLPDSYIGVLNSTKSLERPPTELLHMLAFARDVFKASGGIFNISVGGKLAQLGYGKGQSRSVIKDNLWDHVTMTSEIITIPEHVEIDLGGFGKGWLIDAIGELLVALGYSEFVINGGGDILVKSAKPIELALEHPYDPTQMIGTTRITDGALGASSNTKRVWVKDGKKHGHIIDPRTGETSESEIVATYIQASTALIADTMATILLIAPDLEQTLKEKYQLKTILLQSSQLN